RATVEPAGSRQGRIENVSAVRGGDDDHAVPGLEPVHLREDLVERLLLLVVAPDAKTRAAAASDGVELVDEDDRGRRLARLGEQVAYARRANADDRLHELRCGLAEEGDLRLPGHGTREQGLAGARRPDEEDSFGYGAPKARVLLRLTQEVDELLELLLDLIDPGDVGERRPRPLRVVEPR